MVRSKRALSANERGATMLEFALVAIVLIGLLGVILDIGIALRNYSLMTNATSTVVREMAVSFAGKSVPELCEGVPAPPAASCALLEGCVETVAADYLGNRLGIAGQFAFDSQLANGGAATGNRYILRLQAQHTTSCFFCQLIPGGLVLTTGGIATIQNAGFTC